MIVVITLIVLIVVYIVIERVYIACWDKKLDIAVHLPTENVHENETANITEIITNDKFLPLPTLEIFFHFDKGLKYTNMENSLVSDKLYRRDVFAVGIKKKITRTFEITCEKRGYYSIDKLEMMSTDLFMAKKFLGEHSFYEDFYVYPRKVRSDKIALPYQQVMGELMVKKQLYEDPFAFGGIRDYVNTDPMNKINWKATAKSQDLVVNMFESSINQTVVVLLDTFENRTFFSEDLNEESIRIASALTERLFMQGVEVSLYGNGRDILTKEKLALTGLKGLGSALMKQYLARLERGHEESITTLFDDIPKGAFVVIISKNQGIQEAIQTKLKDYLWILPYKYELPKLEGMRNKYMLWELEANNRT
ncbi:MAG: DUF58 domain-containing protein [Lachnospiraceae bacterium]